MIALVDVNSFYASCEQVFRPDLKGKPVVVLSNNDGCTIAANKEAKGLGIPMWKPAFKNKALFAQHEVTVFSSNYALYGDMSNRVMDILRRFTPELEVYSIDEAFLNLSGINEDLTSYGIKIRQTILKHLGLPVGVGIAPTKSLAKVANKIAKTYSAQFGGAYVIDSEEKRVKALKWTDVGDVWGIGHKHAKRLEKIGVHKAYDFTLLSDLWVQKNMSVIGLRLKHELRGIPQLSIEEVPTAKKIIATQKSFGRNLDDYSLIKEALAYYVAECALKLRRQESLCAQITVLVETNPFKNTEPQYKNSITTTLPFSSDCSMTLTKYAERALVKIFRQGYRYKRVGIFLSALSDNRVQQQNLFIAEDIPQRKALMCCMDSINAKYGKGTLHTASAGFRRKQWKLRQEQLSPRYTTRFEDIMLIKNTNNDVGNERKKNDLKSKR